MSDDPTQQMPSSESGLQTQRPTKKWGLASLVSLIATALLFFSFFLPWFGWSSWSCSGSDCQAVTLSVKTNPPVSSGFSVASNGVSLVSASATVGNRAVIAASIDNFSFPLLWLVLVISIVLFLSQILMNLFKTVARWEQPFTLIITAVALYVEIFYMASAFEGPKQVIPNSTPGNSVSVTGSRSIDIFATLHLSSATSN